jgi:DNA-binding transcriptional LysR family regulator
MDLPQISHFLALARLLNFTRAAEECSITQPAFSRSIRRLELELGGDLLLRERSLTQLTKFGQAMLPRPKRDSSIRMRVRPFTSGSAHGLDCP